MRDYELTNGLTSIQNLGWSTNHENILVITGNESGLGPGRHKNIVYYDVEKLNVLQTAASIQAVQLGLPNEIRVGASNLEEHILTPGS